MRDLLSTESIDHFEPTDPLLDLKLIDWPPSDCDEKKFASSSIRFSGDFAEQ